MSNIKTAFDPATMGFGKHTYKTIDPDTINPSDFAKNLHGDQEKFGDVREYNSGSNEKHQDNDLAIDWLGRVGTVFSTEAEGYQGSWMVVQMPLVKTPKTYCRVAKVTGQDGDDFTIEEKVVAIDMTDLGVTVDHLNFYKPVVTKLIKKGSVDRKQRERLTKRA